MQVKGPEGLLVDEELSCIFPDSLALNGLIDNVLGKFDVHVVNEGIDVLIDQGKVVLGVLPRQVDVLQDFLGVHTHFSDVLNRKS